VRRICHALALLVSGCTFDPGAAVIVEQRAPPVEPSGGVAPPIDPTAGETVEVKLELADASAALATLGLSDGDADATQAVWFYETSALALFDAGVILRARKIHSGADDATVKARPMLPDETPPGWLALAGSKCEVDETTANAASSCSLTTTPAKGAIDDVASGAAAIGSLYDPDQLVFLGSLDAGVSIDALATFGPIAATEWTTGSLALERWDLPNGTQLLEASFRVAHADAASGLAALVTWATANALAIAPDQSDKTGTALRSF
jgi:hypothetical protein